MGPSYEKGNGGPIDKFGGCFHWQHRFIDGPTESTSYHGDGYDHSNQILVLRWGYQQKLYPDHVHPFVLITQFTTVMVSAGPFVDTILTRLVKVFKKNLGEQNEEQK